MHPITVPGWVDRDLWPFAPHTHGLEEGRLHFVDEGQGAPVLFVHGTPTWSIDWRHLLRGLAPNHRVIAVDHLGFGLSDRPAAAGYRPEDHADRFARFATSLDLHDVTLVVHDFGGPIALPWALDHLDRIARVVIVNTWAWPLTDPSLRMGGRLLGSWLGRLLYRWLDLSLRVVAPSAWADRSKLTPQLHGQHLAAFADEPRARVTVLWALARALLGSEGFYAQLAERLPELNTVPVELVWGLQDPAFPPTVYAEWRRRFPDARTLELEHAGHWPHEECAEEVLAFLAG